MAFTKIDHICINQFKLAMHQYFIPNCFYTKCGSIYYTGSVLIRQLCEDDTDILFTSPLKMTEFYRFIQVCLNGTSKET